MPLTYQQCWCNLLVEVVHCLGHALAHPPTRRETQHILQPWWF
jgi:hypothetical protein